MRDTVTISITRPMKEKLDRITREEHLNRSDVVREALRQYFARREFQRLRERVVPEAEKKGIFTDEEVFRQVS